MKKVFFVIFLFFALQTNAFAQTGISFVYVNGSNIKDSKIIKWYIKGIQEFHPCLKKAFEHDPSTQKLLLKDGKYFIEEVPVIFCWGDKKHNNSASKKQKPSVSKGLATWIAYKIRSTAKNVLHDIVWVEKHRNMTLVVDSLHKSVRAETQKGHKILLYGYSSGSFITYEYLLSRTPYINVTDFFNSFGISQEQKIFVSQHPMKNTCVSAIEKNLGVFSSDGQIMLNNDFDTFKKNYMNLDKETCNLCIPNNAVIGMINLASPFALFRSDISDPEFHLTYYNSILYKYILENDMFWLTVNYREDPLSFPGGKNMTTRQIEDITKLTIAPNGGFIYDKSDAKGGFLAISHTRYLTKPKNLSKVVVKAYVEGYEHQYGNGFK